MFKPNTARTLLAGVCLAALAAGRAHAQAVDYTSLQQMFGEPITTSVTGSPQRASEAPAAMTILTQDDIRRSGADNLPDILQFVTGIDIRRYSFGQADIAVRGYDQPLSPRMLVLVNGRQVYLDDYGYVDWNAIPVVLSEIRQIEVVKGPQSALFGFNAAAGVINIITYDPLLDTTNSATARTGTQHLGEGEAVGTGHIGKTFGVRVSLGGYTAHEFSGADTSSFPAPRNGRLNLDARWQITTRILLRAEAGMTDNRYSSFIPLGHYAQTQNRSNDIRAGAAAETGFGVVDLDLYRNQTQTMRQSFYEGSIPDPATDSIDIVHVAKLSDVFKLGSRNTIRLGVEYRNNLGSSQALYRGTLNYDDYAASAMWNATLTSRLSMVNAVRLDKAVLHSDADIFNVVGNSLALYNHTTITEPTFNTGFVFAASSADSVRLTAARGLQMPSLYDLGYQARTSHGPNQAVYVVGTPKVAPTAVWNLDLGYDRTLAAIDSTLTVDGFLQRNTDLIGSLGAGPLVVFSAGIAATGANIGSSNEAGAEIGIKGKSAHGLRWNASYRFVALSQDIASTSPATAVSSFARSTPRHELILGAGATVRKWEFDLEGRWQSSYLDYYFTRTITNTIDVGNYVTLSGRIGYDLTRNITLALSGQQFGLARITEDAGIKVERRVIASGTVHF